MFCYPYDLFYVVIYLCIVAHITIYISYVFKFSSYLIFPFPLKRGFVLVSFMSMTWSINNTIQYKSVATFWYGLKVKLLSAYTGSSATKTNIPGDLLQYVYIKIHYITYFYPIFIKDFK